MGHVQNARRQIVAKLNRTEKRVDRRRICRFIDGPVLERSLARLPDRYRSTSLAVRNSPGRKQRVQARNGKLFLPILPAEPSCHVTVAKPFGTGNSFSGIRSMKHATLLLLLLTGCHCMPFQPCTERYCDVIDDIGDSRPSWEHLYNPKLDLTRLGRSDGPGCCRNQCCR